MGGRSDGGSLLIYRYQPDSASREEIPLEMGSQATSSVAVSDLNVDGALDILVGGGSDSVVWYENSM